MVATNLETSIRHESAIAPSHPIPASDIADLSQRRDLGISRIGELSQIGSADCVDRKWVMLSVSIAAMSFLLMHIADMNFCDPDMWHEMSLFRQSLVEGWVPTVDRFSYTPTVNPSIHHEWGAGAIFYGVATNFGATGVMVLKFALVSGVLAACFWCARQRGASTAVFCVVAPAMALFASYGFTTIRAQVFTLLLLAVMLCCLELDQKGRRWWIALWLPLHVLWLNVHAGFIVGAGLMFFHACEQIVRRQPYKHFIAVGTALAALVMINPYGIEYIPYLMHGLTMARPLIVEWNPLWMHDSRVFGLYLLSLLPVAYCVKQLGWRRMTGLVLVAATAYAALKHTRHLSLYCVVWTCYVPAYLQQTKLGASIDQFVSQHGRFVTQLSAVIAVACVVRSIPASPWELKIPSTNEDAKAGLVCYPVGAVQYLDDIGFQGNLMTPFEVGGYAMWNLFPNAKVSLDGRYEVAYQPGVLEEHLLLYAAKPGWQDVLTKYPTDVVLVPSVSRLSAAIPTMAGWSKAYDDGIFQLYTRPGFSLLDSALAARFADRIAKKTHLPAEVSCSMAQATASRTTSDASSR